MKTRYLLGLPFVTLKLNTEEVEFLIDTGFNGALLLPQEKVNELKLPKAGRAEYVMADGMLSETELFSAEVDWFGSKREVLVVSSPADFALVGMELLSELKITMAASKGILNVDMQ